MTHKALPWSSLLLALLGAGTARAASLDNLEIGGPWGTPTATDGTAVWWNPAGLAAAHGTRIMIEGAPLHGRVSYTRDDEYGYDGIDTTNSFGVVPFLGVATDASVKGLGLGLSVFVPVARGGAVVDEIPTMDLYPQDGPVPPEGGVGRYHLREAKVQALYAMLGAAYEIEERVSIGAGAALIDSTWQSRLDNQVLSSLDSQIEDATGGDSGYTNAQVMDPHYATTVQFEPLKDLAFTFNAGVRGKIIPDMLSAGVSYTHGVRLDHSGDMQLKFNCPPTSDTVGRFAAESLGICYTTVDAHGTVGFRLPSRVNASVLVEPTPWLDVTLMGGWVGWSVFTDYEIGIHDVTTQDDVQDPEALAAAIEKDTLRARAARDTGWGGIDIKADPTEWLTVGGRVLYDNAAIPDMAVSSNNYDANDLMLTGLVAGRPVPWLEIGVSYTQHVLETRVISDSAFGVNVEEGPKNEERWSYPDANGTYQGSIQRVGIQVRAHFGAGGKEDETTDEDVFEPTPRKKKKKDEVEKPSQPDDPSDVDWTKPPTGPGPTVPPPE